MKRAGFVVAVSFAWALGMVPACGGESIVIGGDPQSNDLGGGPATGGAAPTGGTNLETGGSTAGTVTGGTTATGGVGVGGVSTSNGGTSTQNGGSVFGGGTAPFGGAAGVGAAAGAGPGVGATGAGGTGAVSDPYPPVAYEGGQGYRLSCPKHDDTWGFTCWNASTVVPLEIRGCSPDGDPSCNACSCAVPCVDGVACPQGVTGHPAECIESATTAPSCFLTCEDGLSCPPDMLCSRYPGTDRQVCMWVADEPT